MAAGGGGLVKCTINKMGGENNDQIVENIEVLFNPKEYVVEKMAPWQEHHNAGLDNPELQWTTGECMMLSMELFFDTYEKPGDERDVKKITSKIHALAHVDGELHRPPVCVVTWGQSLRFKGILTYIKERYTKFLADGTAVRCVMNVRFVEFTPPTEQLQRTKYHSPDHFKRRIVRQGDTLSWIAGKEYGNPSAWRAIADVNGIDDPMNLTPGQELIIPPIV